MPTFLAQRICLFAALAITTASQVARAASMYNATVLSNPTDNEALQVAGLNNSGQIAGSLATSVVAPTGNSLPYSTYGGYITGGNASGQVTYIGPTTSAIAPGDLFTNVNGINNAGQVVGLQGNVMTGGSGQGFLDSGGKTTALPGNPTAINDVGQIGIVAVPPNASPFNATVTDGTLAHSYILGTNGSMKDIGVAPGTNGTAISALNNNGQAAGLAYTAATSTQPETRVPFYYDGNNIKLLGSFGGTYGEVTGINNSGQVVGYSSLGAPTYMTHAFLSNQGGPMIDLGTLPGYAESIASSINDKGQIVGTALEAIVTWKNGSPQVLTVPLTSPFLYQDGVMTSIQSLINPAIGLTIQQAVAINDLEQIAVYGYYNNEPNLERLFLLTPSDLPAPATPTPLIAPVPEPSSIAVFGVLVAGPSLAARRRRKGSN